VSDDLYESSFGDLRIFASRISTSSGRSQVVHELAAGDEYVVDDRGRARIVARCSVLFDFMVGDELSPLERLRALKALVDDKPRFFRHPVEGTFLARVGPFDYELEEGGTITADVEFSAVSEVEAVSPAGAGGIPSSGEGAVSAAAEALAIELEEVGIESTLPADAIAAVDGWASSDDLNPRDVLAQTGSLTSSLGELAEDLETGLATWSALKATILLAEAVRSAAEAQTAETAQTFVLRLGSAVAARALIADVYGGENFDRFYDAFLRLNDVANPSTLDAGTELQMPALSPQSRSG
jgi:hypothetical protein